MCFLGLLYEIYKLAKFSIKAIDFSYTQVTRDAHLLEYGEQGHVRVMGC